MRGCLRINLAWSKWTVAILPVLIIGCSDRFSGCGQKVVRTLDSPKASQSMVFVTRDCGATTIPLVSVYIVSEGDYKAIDQEGYQLKSKWRAFSFERAKVDAVWMSENAIQVFYDFSPYYGRQGSFLMQKERVGKVKIAYKPVKLDD